MSDYVCTSCGSTSVVIRKMQGSVVLGHYCQPCLAKGAPFPLKGGEGGRGSSDGRIHPGKPGERLENL